MGWRIHRPRTDQFCVVHILAHEHSSIRVAQEKAHAFSAHLLPGKRAVFESARNKSVLPNYCFFYLDDADWGECFIKVCS
jgi:hypothetical protein